MGEQTHCWLAAVWSNHVTSIYGLLPDTTNPKEIWWRVSKPRWKPWNLSGRHRWANNRHNLFKRATIKSLCPSVDLCGLPLNGNPTCYTPHPHSLQTHTHTLPHIWGRTLCTCVLTTPIQFNCIHVKSGQKHTIPLYLFLYYLYCIKEPPKGVYLSLCYPVLYQEVWIAPSRD